MENIKNANDDYLPSHLIDVGSNLENMCHPFPLCIDPLQTSDAEVSSLFYGETGFSWDSL